MKPAFLRREQCCLYVIDPQEKLMAHIYETDRVVRNITLMIHLARTLEMPILVNTQYKKGIGPLVPAIADLLAGLPCPDKICFNGLADPGVQHEVRSLPEDVDTLLLSGVETHICVYQTAIGALQGGFNVLDLLGRAMRAGHPLSAGFKMVADEAPEPIASEFRQVFEEQRFGLSFEDSLLGLGERIRLSDIRILITAILVHRQVGCNLAEILDNIAQLVRERFNLRRQLKVITAQGRMSGYVLAFLPIALGLAIYSLNSDYMMPIFEDQTGRFMLTGAIILQIFGYLWIRRILDIEF